MAIPDSFFPFGKRNTVIIAAIVVVVLVVAVVMLSHSYLSTYALQSELSTATNTPQVLSALNKQMASVNSFNVSYTGSINVGLELNNTNVSLNSAFALDYAKDGNLSRLSAQLGPSGLVGALFGFFSGGVFASGSSQTPSLSNLSGLRMTLYLDTIQNSTGSIQCLAFTNNSRPFNYTCSYSKKQYNISTINSTSVLGENISSLKGLGFKYQGQSTVNGQACSLMTINGNQNGTTVSGNICFSDSLGLPLSASINMLSAPNASQPNLLGLSRITASLQFSSQINSVNTATFSSLPPNSVFAPSSPIFSPQGPGSSGFTNMTLIEQTCSASSGISIGFINNFNTTIFINYAQVDGGVNLTTIPSGFGPGPADFVVSPLSANTTGIAPEQTFFLTPSPTTPKCTAANEVYNADILMSHDTTTNGITQVSTSFGQIYGISTS